MAKKPSKPESKDAGPKTTGTVPLGPACRVAIFHGPEAYLRHGYTEQLKQAVKQAGHDVQVCRYDGATASPADVLDECRSMALLAPYKVVIVDDADLFLAPSRARKATQDQEGDDESAPTSTKPDDRGKGDDKEQESQEGARRRAMLERYAQAPCDNVTLVLRARVWRKGNLDKHAEKVGTVIDCGMLDDARAATWTRAKCRQTHSRDIEPAAVELLVRCLNADLARISTELAKLAGATKDGEIITAAHVERLVPPAAEERKPWELGDVILNPNPTPGMNKLHELLDRCGFDPILLRWTCIDTAAKLHTVAQRIARGASPYSAGEGLKAFFGQRAEACRRIGKSAGPAACASLLREAVRADWRAKTGQQDAVRGLESLVLDFSRAANINTSAHPDR